MECNEKAQARARALIEETRKIKKKIVGGYDGAEGFLLFFSPTLERPGAWVCMNAPAPQTRVRANR
eukprot:scaffold9563_cov150-Skeletonema_marinoi.AAC.12